MRLVLGKVVAAKGVDDAVDLLGLSGEPEGLEVEPAKREGGKSG